MRGVTRVLLGLGAGCLILALLAGAIGLCLGGRFGSFQPTPEGLRYLPGGGNGLNWAALDEEGRAEQPVELPAGNFAGLELEGGLASVTVRPGEAWKLTATHPELYEVSREDGRLVIGSRNVAAGQAVRNARLTLEFPAGAQLETVELSTGLGAVAVSDLTAGALTVDAGMSQVTLTDVTVRGEAELECGMGALEAEGLAAGSLTMRCDLGSMKVTGAAVAGETALHCGSGAAELAGELAGSLTADCGLGQLTVTTPEPAAYGLQADCGMGSLTVGGRRVNGPDGSLTMESDAAVQYRLSVDMGELTVRFAE